MASCHSSLRGIRTAHTTWGVVVHGNLQTPGPQAPCIWQSKRSLAANVPSTESMCHPQQLDSQTLGSEVANLTSAFGSSAEDR